MYGGTSNVMGWASHMKCFLAVCLFVHLNCIHSFIKTDIFWACEYLLKTPVLKDSPVYKGNYNSFSRNAH